MVRRLFKIPNFSQHLISTKNKKNELIEVRSSGIHGKGVFAKCDIPKGTEIIQYKGQLLTKDESDERSDRDNERGTVYLSTLNDHFDIDGWVNGNEAKYINHSCKPNCEAVLHEDEDDYAEDEIWIEAISDIKEGEELGYMYNFDDPEHICKCGNDNCIGHM